MFFEVWGSTTLSPLNETEGIFIFHTPKSVISYSLQDRLLDGPDTARRVKTTRIRLDRSNALICLGYGADKHGHEKNAHITSLAKV